MEYKKPCTDCPYSRNKCGFGGNFESDFVIVGEGASLDDLRRGEPFSGPGGTVLKAHLPKGITPFYTNVLQCYPGKAKNDDRQARAMHSCQGRFLEEIKARPRKVIVALGTTALQALTNTTKGITRARGKLVESELASVGIVPTFHPTFLMRGGGTDKVFHEDLEYAASLYKDRTGKLYRDPENIIIVDEDTLEQHLDDLFNIHTSPEIACDLETGGFDFLGDEVLCLSMNKDPETSYIIPEDLLYSHRHIIKPYMEDPDQVFIWHNGQFDIKFMAHQLQIDARVDEDTMLLSYALNERGGIHDLDYVAADRLGAPNHKAMLDKHKKSKESYRVIPKDILYHYAGIDTSKTLQIFRSLREEVRDHERLEKLYTKVLVPAIPYLAYIESNGMYPNRAQNADNLNTVGLQVEELKYELNEVAKVDGFDGLNPNSPKQLKKYLYDFLELKVRGRIPTDTTKETLEKLPDHPFIVALRKYRKVQKAYSTYIVPFKSWISQDGRIHTSYKLHGTTTGRLASADPNLQNQPRLKIYKNQFMAAPGYLLLECDLGQAELRSLAQLSGCTALSAIYLNDELSLHDEVAIELFGENFSKEDKMRAKAVNFGIVYGRTAISLAMEFEISLEEAQGWIDTWMNRFPGAAAYIKRCRGVPDVSGSMYTVFGRYRRFHFTSGFSRNAARNEAANFPHQSTASDITLVAGTKVYPRLAQYDSRVVNTVHDSIITEVPIHIPTILKVRDMIQKELVTVPTEWGLTDIPFASDSAISKGWGELTDFKTEADLRKILVDFEIPLDVQ